MDLDACLCRRTLLGAGLGMLLPTPAWASEAPAMAREFWRRPRRLRLQHLSGERLDIVYWSDGQLIQSAWQEVSFFMRDRVVGRGVYMSPVLLDILYGIDGWLQYYSVNSPIVFHSGFRDYSRNLTIEGAAQNSEHPKGGAGDISIPGVNSLQTARFGLWLGGGGVGWYPSRNFIHLDKGRIRSWQG